MLYACSIYVIALLRVVYAERKICRVVVLRVCLWAKKPEVVRGLAVTLLISKKLKFVSLALALPLCLFENLSKLIYVNNPKAVCTLTQNILFFANLKCPYFDLIELHFSPSYS